MARFCAECGAALAEGAKFCPTCGKPVALGSEGAPAATASLAPADATVTPAELSPSYPYAVSANGEVLQSAAPLPSTTSWVKWGYIISLILTPVGGVGVIGLIAVFIIHNFQLSAQKGKMRDKKFRFVEPRPSDDEIFNRLQPALTRKYGNAFEFDRDGKTLCVRYQSVLFDINVNEDGTFSLWWRKSLSGAIFSFNDVKLYRKIRRGMGMIAYELQQQFGVK